MSASDDKNKRLSLPEREEGILEFWEKNKIFEKSVDQRKKSKRFVFYDGPPFATGLPHYGHILASVIKDVAPRYWTMKGFRVDRRWGWDCHGLPIENLVEQDLNISGRKSIEEFGIKKFNETARSKVLTYVSEWKKTIRRIGRFVDFENSYKTMDITYMESVWWAFSALHKKNLIYQDERISLFCPRCETSLSNFEIAMDNSYIDKEDNSVYVKFLLEGKDNEYLLIWTTTPWTLPGNSAVAVNPKIDYVKYKIIEQDGGGKNSKAKEYYVWSAIDLDEKEAEAVEKVMGESLVGRKYQPPFRLSEDEKSYRVVAADFVNTEEGTGLVHIAPAFGEEDFNLGKKENLSVLNPLDDTGKFSAKYPMLGFLTGKSGEEANKLIIERLKSEDLIWKVKKIVHRYPVCWRCQTPLIYKIQPAWFVKISSLKPKMLALNEKIDWQPAHLKNGRFKNGLETAPDWNLSRSRFWGTPIPIWICQNVKKQKSKPCDSIVIGSLGDLEKRSRKSGNKYFLIRHGLAETNVLGISNSWPERTPYHLVEKGRAQVEAAAKKIKKEKIDFIVSSDMLRAKETTGILAKSLKVEIIFDERLRDFDVGEFNGKPSSGHDALFKNVQEKFVKPFPKGESWNDLKKRMHGFISDIDRKYKNKNILIVGHGDPLWILEGMSKNLSDNELLKSHYIKNAEIRRIKWQDMPRDDYGRIDIHRPYIDDFQIFCGCGFEAKRVFDVFDCWLESGSMPFAEKHYPFENKDKFEKNFPADFISEYIAQTRGWFYVLHVLSTALFGKQAFNHVITTGTILSEKGEKLSKSRKNFPDPNLLFSKYGVDAIRYYMMTSPVMLSENINFSEKEVDEVYKKYSLILINVLNFFKLFSGKLKKSDIKSLKPSKNVLDRWILSRLHFLIQSATVSFDNYRIVEAARPMLDFVQDLSLWYVRRSRERIKSDSADAKDALRTLYFVLRDLSLMIAPITPFLAEIIYQEIGFCKKKSAHLEDWPKCDKKLISKDIENKMEAIRNVVSKALRLRAEAKIKVRQPLSLLKIKEDSIGLRKSEDLLELIKEETNVKEIIFDKNIKNGVELSIVLTPQLKEEGFLRELTHAIQELRKKISLTPKDRPKLFVSANSEGKVFIERHKNLITEESLLSGIEFKENLWEDASLEKAVLKDELIEINIALLKF